MKYIFINNKLKKLSKIGIGHLGIESSMIKHFNDRELIEQLDLALDCGMNFIDTAENYGHSEKIIGNTIKNFDRNKIYIASKVSPENLKYNSVINSCEKSLKRLKTDYIDLYQIHWPNPDIELEETLNAMMKLKNDGKINCIGVSNFPLLLLEKAKSLAEIDSIQMEYNLVDNDSAWSIKNYCDIHDMLFIAYSPLAFPFKTHSEKWEVLNTLKAKHFVTQYQIILNWIAFEGNNIISIPKSNNMKHILENSSAMDFKLDWEDRMLLSSVFRTKVQKIKMKDIKVSGGGKENRKSYSTIKEAKENLLNFVPSPNSLAEFDLEYSSGRLQPIKVTISSDINYKYELYEGRIKYWSNAIRFDGDMEQTINCIVI